MEPRDTVASQTHSLVSGTGGGLTRQFLTSSSEHVAAARGTRNCGLAQDRVQGFITSLTTAQMCPSPSGMAPPWPPCQSAYLATLPRVQKVLP